jgi:DNA topoisomerase-1
VYTGDDKAGYGRRGQPGHFHYVDRRGRRIRDAAILCRIRHLAIPPAWTDVWINPRPRGHLQASGHDSRGRKQYLYHPAWRAVRDAAKFEHVQRFARVLPQLRRAVGTSLRRPRLDRERVTAVIVRLLETSLIRVGNAEYARANHSYGLTTLRTRHATVRGSRIRFAFRGKSGLRHRIEMASPNLARVVRRLQELPGQELFCYLDAEGKSRRLRSEDVNAYLRAHTGASFTAKDFRTWAGTMLAAMTLAQLPTPASKREANRAQAAAVRAVAARLGNTPAIARRSYIHPMVFEAYAAGRLSSLPPPDTWPPTAPRIRLTPEERTVLRVLQQNATAVSAPTGSIRQSPGRAHAHRSAS